MMVVRLLSLAMMLSVLAGCGYSAKEIYPEQYATVAVPIFENRTFYKRVEFELTEALIKQIEQRTPYKVASPAVADTILQGTIVAIEQDMLARHRPGGVPEQLELTIVVNFEWKDLRTGETLRDRRGFESVGLYVPTRPVGEPVEIAQRTAIERLARDIVTTMQAEW